MHEDPPRGAAAAELVRRRQIQAVATAFLRRRPFMVGPPALLLLTLLAATGVPRAQLFGLAAIKGTMLAFFFWEAWRYRQRDIDYGGLFRSLALTLGGLTAACAVSGGLRSPLLPLLFAPSTLGLAAFGPRRAGLAMMGLLGLSGALLLALPPMASFPPLPESVAALATFATIVVTALLLATGIAGLVEGYQRTGYALGEMRAEVLSEGETHARELATLGARLAHEIRNPLAALKGLLQLEARHVDSERGQRRFAVMETEVVRLEGILTDYLSFSRPAAEAQPQPCRPRVVLREVMALLEGRAQEAGVRLAEEGDDLTLDADARLLKQALFNLYANALEATPRGGQVVGRVRRSDQGAAIEIVDTGRGMDAQALSRVGTPFFSTRPSGTGLGVVIARGIARQHGGELRFESRPGAGTTATLKLPLAAARPEERA